MDISGIVNSLLEFLICVVFLVVECNDKIMFCGCDREVIFCQFIYVCNFIFIMNKFLCEYLEVVNILIYLFYSNEKLEIRLYLIFSLKGYIL